MRKIAMMFAVFAIPLVLGWGMARAADQDNGGFRVALKDGGQVKGAMSLVINLDTPYGKITIPSSSLVSAQFDVAQKWADIQLTDAQLKVRYNPDTSDLKATTAVGPLNLALANVVSVSSATAPNAAAQANVPPPVNYYAQQPQAPVATSPPPVYQYPYTYAYPYNYYAPYYYPPYYDYGGPYFGFGWPYVGFGIGFGHGGFGFHGGFHGGRR